MGEPIIKKDTLGQEFCYIPKKQFLFGRDNDTVRLMGPFYMAKYTVSKNQFLTFVEETGYDYTHSDVMDQISPSSGCPASPVSWDDAKAYARWLRGNTGEYYSLPSEEEWEAAARGTDGRLYPWGGTPPTDKHGTFSITQYRRETNVITSFPMNLSPHGCVDMVGNIWEWCLEDINDEDTHALRGGSCVDNSTLCNCTSRLLASPSTKRVLYAGIRLIYLPGEMYERYCKLTQDK